MDSMTLKNLPSPIWSRRTPRKRPQVSEGSVIEMALQLLDEEGVDAITMRGIAQRLGVTTPTVYWHVESKDGLLDRLYDHLCSEVSFPASGQWQDRLRVLANNIRAVFARHRDAARIAVGRFPLGPNGLRITEAALEALTEAGLNEEEVAYATYLFFSYVTTFSYQETILPASVSTKSRVDALSRIEKYLSALPPEQFPHLTRCAHALSRPGLDLRFAFGLDQLILGISVTSTCNRSL